MTFRSYLVIESLCLSHHLWSINTVPHQLEELGRFEESPRAFSLVIPLAGEILQGCVKHFPVNHGCQRHSKDRGESITALHCCIRFPKPTVVFSELDADLVGSERTITFCTAVEDQWALPVLDGFVYTPCLLIHNPKYLECVRRPVYLKLVM